jgi:hypothetical protein
LAAFRVDLAVIPEQRSWSQTAPPQYLGVRRLAWLPSNHQKGKIDDRHYCSCHHRRQGRVPAVRHAIAPRLAELTGTTVTTEYALGVFFVAYGATVFALTLLPSVRSAGIGVMIANIVYTVAAVGVMLAGVWPLTTLGVVFTLGSGLYTLVMADLQYLGLRRMRS